MIGIEREYIRFQKCGDQLIEHRFRSSMPWPSTGKFYALASDPESVERCKRFALRTPEERVAEKAAADARHERYRVKQTAMPVMQVEEPAPPTPPPAKRFTVPTARRRPNMPAPRRNP
ncbi:hypothetical protein [Rhizobium ruizarguesonis]|uniref:hypothetical protein n=1 Tax=Rhizobium ruizarguesonis TaxID=2081791 RepID=UPI00103267F1|nr:hypothetical protein [Rhizobium ruizarguesonis]TAV14717.1 hypothetical protein ELI34_04205 [Rhizobium ruizarguesonis]